MGYNFDGIVEKGLNQEEMESFKHKLKYWSNTFLSKAERDDEIIAYSIFFRSLKHDLEGWRGMFPEDFVKICRRIVYGPDSAFVGYDETKGFIFDSVPTIADMFLPKWFADAVRKIIILQPQNQQ